jgi:hypothetical protein
MYFNLKQEICQWIYEQSGEYVSDLIIGEEGAYLDGYKKSYKVYDNGDNFAVNYIDHKQGVSISSPAFWKTEPETKLKTKLKIKPSAINPVNKSHITKPTTKPTVPLTKPEHNKSAKFVNRWPNLSTIPHSFANQYFGNMTLGNVRYSHHNECPVINIPVFNADTGKMIGGQYVYEDRKTYTKGIRKKKNKGCHILGDVTTAKKIYGVEGYRTGIAVKNALGENYAVVVCFDAGSLKEVMKSIHKQTPGIPKIIVGDDDRYGEKNLGRIKAQEAAQAIGAEVIFPKFTETTTKPTDFADLYFLEGKEEVYRQIRPYLTVEYRDDQYLGEITRRENEILLLGLPTGMGKTETATQIANSLKQSTSIISPTRALCAEAAKRFDAYLYTDPKANQKYRVVSTPDSLPKISPKTINFSDEFKQISSAIAEGRMADPEQSYNALKMHLSRAEWVVAADAYFNPNDEDIHFIHLVTGKNIRLILPTAARKTDRQNQVLKLFNSKYGLEARIIEGTQQGEKSLVACETLKQTKVLYRLLKPLGMKLKILLINSETAGNPAVMKALENINQAVLDYDIILYSPIIGSGLNITEEVFDKVYLFGGEGVLDPESLLQMLFRYRPAVDVYAYLANRNFHRPEDWITVLQSQLAERHKDDREYETIIARRIYTNMPLPPKYQPKEYDEFAARKEAEQNYKKNHCKPLFLAEMTARGFTIVNVKDIGDSETSREARTKVVEDEKQAIIAAKAINETQAKRLEKEDKITEPEVHELKAFRIRSFWQLGNQELTLDHLDHYHQYRLPILRVETATQPLDKIFPKVERDRKQVLNRQKFYLSTRQLVNQLFDLLGIQIVEGLPVCHEPKELNLQSIQPFYEWLQSPEGITAQRIKKFSPNWNKSMQYFSGFCRQFGLTLKSRKIRLPNGTTQRVYQLNLKNLETFRFLLNRRLPKIQLNQPCTTLNRENVKNDPSTRWNMNGNNELIKITPGTSEEPGNHDEPYNNWKKESGYTDLLKGLDLEPVDPNEMDNFDEVSWYETQRQQLDELIERGVLLIE